MALHLASCSMFQQVQVDCRTKHCKGRCLKQSLETYCEANAAPVTLEQCRLRGDEIDEGPLCGSHIS